MQVVKGSSILLNREAFISNPSIDYVNANSILGEIIKQEYYSHFALKVSLQKKSKEYKVKSGLLFNAIEKINPKPDDYCILSFGINISYYKDYMGADIKEAKPDDKENYTFNSIPIFCFDKGLSRISNTIYIIEKRFLPMIVHRDWSEIEDLPEKIKEYWRSMGESINSELKIYKKIIELNDDEVLKAEYKKQGKDEEKLKNMLEVNYDFLGYVWFNKDTELIELKEIVLFQEGGIFDEIDDIKPLKQ